MNAVNETYGNGLWLQNSFDPATGEPLTRQSGTGGLPNIRIQEPLVQSVWPSQGQLLGSSC